MRARPGPAGRPARPDPKIPTPGRSGISRPGPNYLALPLWPVRANQDQAGTSRAGHFAKKGPAGLDPGRAGAGPGPRSLPFFPPTRLVFGVLTSIRKELVQVRRGTGSPRTLQMVPQLCDALAPYDATFLEKNGKGHFWVRPGRPAGRARPGPAGHSKNGFPNHEIII